MLNFKGNFFIDNTDSAQRYTCPETGAHFEFNAICSKLTIIFEERRQSDEAVVVSPNEPPQIQIFETSNNNEESVTNQGGSGMHPATLEPGKNGGPTKRTSKLLEVKSGTSEIKRDSIKISEDKSSLKLPEVEENIALNK